LANVATYVKYYLSFFLKYASVSKNGTDVSGFRIDLSQRAWGKKSEDRTLVLIVVLSRLYEPIVCLYFVYDVRRENEAQIVKIIQIIL